jgi:hypothetical protein
MAATNYTPIQLYYSTTASAVPLAANLVSGELAINITDGKIYYKDNAGVVQLFGSKSDLTTISFGSTGLTPSTATGGAVTVAGTLITSNGGTGLSSFAAGDIMYYSSGTAMSKLTIGTNGQILTSNGTAPTWSTLSSVAVTTFSAGTTGFTPSSATSGAITLAGTLATTNGGTGLTSFTSGGAVYATSTSALTTGTLPVASGGSGAVTLTGILKGNGTSAFSAATAGTDYVAPGTATTFTALQTFAGTSSNADMKVSNILEVDTISATAATGTINFDLTTQSVLYYTSNASANWTVNFRGSSGTALNSIMATGECISATFLVTQGSTAYYNSAVTIDGNSVTPKWQGGTAPTSGNASSIDCYTYVIQKTGSATFTVLASQTKFA